ncbi:MAG: UDP-N-acetylglucosamine 1-carboxyvinyltransferase [Bacteroidales bacterium]|jgi:UDP-N-acetylglucosamine 1-carboxyvinyltransferase|nr:UDP-N-acetylglucosamine 1-carboxyvinyltransferase [Bacteroidales bacterium]MDD3700485.1 UDP-N-acetylglucosamine 1-carboxyvinyltransferase [Bacteroidales bacterium]MDY0369865.1 UDP-N-acetylglucosamine 1-carboxyvinyltransferase [Bacteroidales bacterium]
MSSFIVKGGKTLSGEIQPQGAKNEALQILCACLLTEEVIEVNNLPDIVDVNNLIGLLERMGVKTDRLSSDTVRLQADEIRFDYIKSADFAKRSAQLRGSIMIAGPLLARFGKAYIPKPGGDKIGRRRLDTHIIGLQKLGAGFSGNIEDTLSEMSSKGRLQGAYMLLDEASVTGTANIVMAATLAKGMTTIFNAACEPYIVQLCSMLVRMGAKIYGIGSNLLTIEGVSSLKGTTHTLLSDMIEVGSFIGLAAMTAARLTIKNAGIRHLGMIPDVFARLGIRLEIVGDDIIVPAHEHYEVETFLDGGIMTIADAPWPGFTPDLISIVLVVATQAKGTVLVHQKMFESRLFFVDKLIDMGAQIILCDPHRANVIGIDRRYPLRAIRMSSPDIRAGVALLIAALSAKGTSIIDNIDQIDRGYQRIEQRLQAIGADIQRM